MTPPSPHAFALFLEALDHDAEARDGWLAEATDDPAIRREVTALLAHHDAEDAGPLDRALFGRPERGAAMEDATIGQQIGAWRVTGLLGRGGMGSVYRAARADETFEQHAALKLVHPRLGHDFRARFLRERAVLAGLDHPGIARLLDGGLAPDGAPFLAMELVDGEPLPAYAEAHDLGVGQRIGLFLQACDAVAHAHLHLIVHRDLKPPHILVEDAEGGPRVKLLDFGIAKLLSEDGSDLTRTGASGPLTPSYAAPEQILGQPITTATDVYGLGLVLYELLTGARPYVLDGLSAAQTERVICETVPQPLSAAAAPEAARALRGDLDTIVAMALAKEPARRYPTAADLAADLRRFLAGHPVEARPATAAYRTSRFLRRHRLAAGAATLVALSLVGGAGVSLWQAGEARAEAAKAEAVSTFLVDLFNAPNPEADGRDVRTASLLDAAAAGLDTAFVGTPETEAQLRLTLGVTYRGLGLYDEAATQLRRALALRTQVFGADRLEVSEVQLSLGRLSYELGDYAAADSILALALATERRRSGPDDPRTINVLNEVGMVRYDLGDYAGAVAAWRETLDHDEATKPPGDFDLTISRANLANALADLGEIDPAAALLEQAAAEMRQYHPGDITLYNTLANLGSLRNDQGRSREAAALQREALKGSRALYGDRHTKVAFRLTSLGSTLGLLRRDREAEPLLREAIATYQSLFGPGHPNEAYPLRALAGTLLRLGHPTEAEAAARRAVAISAEAYGDDHAKTAQAQVVLAEVLLATDRAGEAERVLRPTLAPLEASLPEDHRDRGQAQSLLGDALLRDGRTAAAAPLLRDGHARLLRTLGPEHALTRDAAVRLARSS